jgi:hypothetical protein
MNIDKKLHIGFIAQTSDENNKPHFTLVNTALRECTKVKQRQQLS